MILTRLHIRQLRCLADAELQPQPGLNVLVGANGAGKSSVIEAMHLLGYGRSFRGRVSDGLVRTGAPHLEVYAEWRDGAGGPHRAGLRHNGGRWEARLDGASAPSLTELCAQVAVVTFEPGSHDLVAGGFEPDPQGGGDFCVVLNDEDLVHDDICSFPFNGSASAVPFF